MLAATELLNCFLHTPKLTIKQLVEFSKMTRNRVSRILGTLIHAGYIMECSENGVFTVGPKMMALGNIFKENQSLLTIVKESLRSLSLATGESATFYMREGKERVVMAREEGTSPIRYSVAVGQRMDLHAGAAGKVLLAYLPANERSLLLASIERAQYTQATITTTSQLTRELDQIRANGYAISRGERDPDAFSLAAPVFERHDHPLGAIAIAGPISRFSQEREACYLRELLSAASLFSARFGLGRNPG